MRIFLVLMSVGMMTSGCHLGHRGNIEERCNLDGSCNGPTLTCQSIFADGSTGCYPKPAVDKRCSYESECFCVSCAEKCGEKGVKSCAYSDTSVWGSKPAVCECKP